MFIVHRILNSHGDKDYLCGWDRKWGTVCSSKIYVAMYFSSIGDARAAANKAQSLVPSFINGKLIAWGITSL
jgi:hypothetical protein